MIFAKAKKRKNTTADQSEFNFEVSVERRPETFLVLVVTVRVEKYLNDYNFRRTFKALTFKVYRYEK